MSADLAPFDPAHVVDGAALLAEQGAASWGGRP